MTVQAVVYVALMLGRTAQWALAAAQLLLLPSGVVIIVKTNELSVCKVIVHLGFQAWKLKPLAGSVIICSCLYCYSVITALAVLFPF